MRSFILLVFVFISLHASAIKDSKEVINVNATKIQVIDLYDSYENIGSTRALPSKDFFATIGGSVDYIIPSDKTKVKANDIIMQINKDYAENYKNEANLAYQNALNLLNDAQKLYDRNFTSQSDVDSKKLEALMAAKNLQLMKDRYNDLVIKAPFDGNIGAISYQVGDSVNVGDYLFSIIGSDDKEFVFALPEKLLGKINDTSEILIYKINKDDSVKADITNISPYLIPKANNFTIIANIKNAPYFPHNSIVRAKIIYNKHEALAIPESSLLQNENGYFLFLVTDDNKAKKVYVKTYSRIDDMIEVASPEIKEGDLIVTKGLNKLLDGSMVNITQE